MKTGRPKLPDKDRRGETLILRVTEAEHATITEAAKRAGLDVSEWARQRLLGPRPMSSLNYDGVFKIETPSDMTEKEWEFLKRYVLEVMKP